MLNIKGENSRPNKNNIIPAKPILSFIKLLVFKP
jgi:hypothetical protein